MAITLSILNGFSNFFHCWKENKIFYKTHIILLAIPSVCWQSYHHEFSYYVLGHSVYRRSILHSHTRWHQVMKRFVDYSNENWVGLVRQMAPNHFCKIDEDGAGWADVFRQKRSWSVPNIIRINEGVLQTQELKQCGKTFWANLYIHQVTRQKWLNGGENWSVMNNNYRSKLDCAQRVQTPAKASNFNWKWSGIPIWISGVIWIWIRMSVRSLPKCCVITHRHVSHFVRESWKSAGDGTRNTNKSPKNPLFRNDDESAKVIQNPYPRPDQHQKSFSSSNW